MRCVCWLGGGDAVGKPTVGNLVDELERFATFEAGPEDLFAFFSAGHGTEVDGQQYLLLQEARWRSAFTYLPFHTFCNQINKLSLSRRIFILDACRNHPEHGKADADNIQEDSFTRELEKMLPAPDASGVTAVLSACKPGQRAYEWKHSKHGVFTASILESVPKLIEKGACDFDHLAVWNRSTVSESSADSTQEFLSNSVNSLFWNFPKISE